MADRKISELAALTTPAAGDYLPIVDVSEAAASDKNKRITVQTLYQGIPVDVGIGDSAPQAALEINTNSSSGVSSDALILTSGGGGAGAGAKLYFSGIGSVPKTRGAIIEGVITTPNAHDLVFYTCGTGSNPTEKVRIDSSGRLLVNTSSSRDQYNNTTGQAPKLQVESIAGEPSNVIGIVRNSNNTAESVFVLAKSRGATAGSATIVSSGDSIGTISFQGADGTDLVPAAAITAQVDATPGANDMPGRLVFSTTADGASTPTERMRIQRNGNIAYYNLASIVPVSDNTVTLGASGYRWSAVWAANGTIQTSDERAKTEIADAELGSDFIKSLRPVSYKWIEGDKRDTGERDEDNNYIYESVPGTRTHWGFIAQEVKQSVDDAGVDFGGWVLTDKDDPDSQQALRYDQFIAPLTKALQEALAKIETLEAKVAALEAQ